MCVCDFFKSINKNDLCINQTKLYGKDDRKNAFNTVGTFTNNIYVCAHNEMKKEQKCKHKTMKHHLHAHFTQQLNDKRKLKHK